VPRNRFGIVAVSPGKERNLPDSETGPEDMRLRFPGHAAEANMWE
jgi:hypothetical protein